MADEIRIFTLGFLPVIAEDFTIGCPTPCLMPLGRYPRAAPNVSVVPLQETGDASWGISREVNRTICETAEGVPCLWMRPVGVISESGCRTTLPKCLLLFMIVLSTVASRSWLTWEQNAQLNLAVRRERLSVTDW
jgi:hypothetical protein